MNIADLIDEIRTGVISIEFLVDGHVWSTGSGFMVDGRLVTNNHVYQGPDNSIVRLSWQISSAPDDKGVVEIPYRVFTAGFLTGDGEHGMDYAILELDCLRGRGLCNLELDCCRDVRVGESILVLGFPFGDKNMSCHSGILSSFKISNGIKVLQVDASVNASNSGGPLVSLRTGKVIGIVTRKATGFFADFSAFRKIIESNIAVIGGMRRGIYVAGVDPVEALLTGQSQALILAKNLYRSANVGIGYAFSIEYVAEEFDRFNS